MFTATLSDVKLLKDSVDTIAQIIDEASFSITKEGISLISADRAMVAVIDFKMSSAAFDSYECEKDTSIGLNLLNFLTILKRAGPGDKLMLKLEEGNRLKIVIKGDSTRAFAMPLLDISRDEVPSINQFEFNASADIDAGIMAKGFDDVDIVADSVIMELGPESLRMFAEGNSSRVELKLDKGSIALPNITATQTVKSRYPLDYLKKMMKAMKISDSTKIQFGNDYPLRIDFRGKKASITMIIAPRVSE